MAAGTLRSNTHLATLVFWHASAGNSWSSQRISIFPKLPMILFPPCRVLAGDFWNKQVILCLLWRHLLIALVGNGCDHWRNLISGDALTRDLLDHYIRVCHMLHQKSVLQWLLIRAATRITTLPMPSSRSEVGKFHKPTVLFLLLLWQYTAYLFITNKTKHNDSWYHGDAVSI